MGNRPGVRFPKFLDTFSVFDVSEERQVPVLSLYDMPPQIQQEEIKIFLCGVDCKTKYLTWKDLQSLPKVKARQPIICHIFNWSEEVIWEGWKLSAVLRHIGLSGRENRYFSFYSRDGLYFESLSRREAMDDRTWLVCGMNRKPLPHEYGGPLRLAAPFLQGYKSVKWLAGIRTFVNDPLGIKILLAQSKNAKLTKEWKNKYGLGPLEGKLTEHK